MHLKGGQGRFYSVGVTIVELLIACSLLICLSVAFSMILSQVRTSSEGGAERIALRATHRQTQKRLSVLLRSAMAPNEVDPAIVEPAYSQSSSMVRFHAPADLIDAAQPFDPRVPDYPEFTVQRDPSTGGLALQRSDGTGPKQLVGQGFSSVRFERTLKRLLTVELSSEKTVRGAADRKTIEENSLNTVQIPGLR